MSDYDYVYKLVILGPLCGKSCLVQRFANDKFQTDYISTIGVDFEITTLTLNNKIFKLQIWDTSGQERFRNIITSYYRSAMGIILCFDLTNTETFNKMRGFLQDIKNCSVFESVKIVLIGCKSDLKDKIIVNNSEINEFINYALLKYGKIIEYFSTSAKCNINVTESFEFLCNYIFDENYPQMIKLKNINLEFLLNYFVRNCKINGMYQWFNGINGIIKVYLCKGY